MSEKERALVFVQQEVIVRLESELARKTKQYNHLKKAQMRSFDAMRRSATSSWMIICFRCKCIIPACMRVKCKQDHCWRSYCEHCQCKALLECSCSKLFCCNPPKGQHRSCFAKHKKKCQG
jgi:hypothetical protein